MQPIYLNRLIISIVPAPAMCWTQVEVKKLKSEDKQWICKKDAAIAQLIYNKIEVMISLQQTANVSKPNWLQTLLAYILAYY